MKITEKFTPGKTLFAFELLPPLKGDNIDTIFDTINRLAPYDPSYINVTYHREEVKLIERPDGLLERRVVRKRPGETGWNSKTSASPTTAQKRPPSPMFPSQRSRGRPWRW